MAAATADRFVLDGKTYTMVTPEELEFREIELIEDAFGQPVEDIDFRMKKALRWLFWCSIRRQDPETTITFDDLGDIKYSAIKDAPAPQDRKRPTKRPAKPRAKAKPKG